MSLRRRGYLIESVNPQMEKFLEEIGGKILLTKKQVLATELGEIGLAKDERKKTTVSLEGNKVVFSYSDYFEVGAEQYGGGRHHNATMSSPEEWPEEEVEIEFSVTVDDKGATVSGRGEVSGAKKKLTYSPVRFKVGSGAAEDEIQACFNSLLSDAEKAVEQEASMGNAAAKRGMGRR